MTPVRRLIALLLATALAAPPALVTGPAAASSLPAALSATCDPLGAAPEDGGATTLFAHCYFCPVGSSAAADRCRAEAMDEPAWTWAVFAAVASVGSRPAASALQSSRAPPFA